MTNPSVPVNSRTDTSLFGFWVYVMTDCILFATLFATYAVLEIGTNGGPTGRDIFNMPFVLIESLLLLTSSFTCGMALLAAKKERIRHVGAWLAATFLLGISFVTMELTEFAQLASEGHGWWSSAFLSAFFTLVGTHGLHIIIGLLWLLVLGVFIMRRGLTEHLQRRLAMFGIFWHFLDIVWVFIFTIVYLMGVA